MAYALSLISPGPRGADNPFHSSLRRGLRLETPVNTKAHLERTAKDPSAGAIAETETGATMLVCALLVATCFAAPIFLTLPETMDTAVNVPPATGRLARAMPGHEREPAPPTLVRTGALDERALETWRLRATD